MRTNKVVHPEDCGASGKLQFMGITPEFMGITSVFMGTTSVFMSITSVLHQQCSSLWCSVVNLGEVQYGAGCCSVN